MSDDPRYKAAKLYDLSDVIIDTKDNIIRIGEYYQTRNGVTSKVFNVDFLKSFCAKNCIKAKSTGKEAIMRSIVSAFRNSWRKQQMTANNDVFGNEKANGVLIEDDSQENKEKQTARSVASNLDEVTDNISNLELGGGRVMNAQNNSSSILSNVMMVDLKKKRLQYQKTELIIALQNQIDAMFEKIKALSSNADNSELVKEMKKEAFLMLDYFLTQRNNLMVEK